MANIIGIDLGTSTTLMASLSNSGEAILVKNSAGDLLTHSAVWFEGGNKVIIGTEAKKMFGVAKDDEIFIEFKRDMGDANVVHKVHGKDWHPRDLWAMGCTFGMACDTNHFGRKNIQIRQWPNRRVSDRARTLGHRQSSWNGRAEGCREPCAALHAGTVHGPIDW